MTDKIPDPLADPEGYVTDPAKLQCSASTFLLVKDIADKLEKLYPGWMWAVQPDERGGVVNIFSMRLSMRWGYRMHTRNVQEDPNRKLAMQAGGEILERFGQVRGPYEYSRWKAANRYMGMLDFDISDKSAAVQRRHRDDQFTQDVRSGRIKIKVEDRKDNAGKTQRSVWLSTAAQQELQNARTH